MNDHLAIRVAMTFGDLAAKSALTLFVAFAVSRVFRKQAAATRHLIWLTAFCILLTLPALTLLTPAREVPVFREAAAASSPKQFVPEQLVGGSTADPISVTTASTPAAHSVVSQASVSATASKAPAAPNWTALITAALSIWLTGVIAVAIQWMWGLVALRRLNTRLGWKPALASCSLDVDGISRLAGLKRNWELRVSDDAQPPAAMTWGLMRPVVLLPNDSCSWSQERLEAVLLHELAHVRRFDSVSQLIALSASALYWFNPAVWLCARAMRAEAEIAADDTVIRLGVKPSAYAQELLRIAAELGHQRQPFTNIGVPVMKQSKIELRVKAILDPSARHRRGVTLIEALAAISVAAVVMVPLSSLRAAIVPSDPPRLAQQHQTRQADQQRQLESVIKTLKGKVAQERGAAHDAENRQLRAALKILVLQTKAMRDQLDRAKAELAVAHVRLEEEAQALQNLQRTRGNVQSRGEADARTKQLMDALQAEERAAMKAQRQAQEQQRTAIEKGTADMKQQILMAQDLMAKAQQDALQAKGSALKVQLIDAKKQLELAQIELVTAKQGYERVHKLYQQGLVPVQNVDEAAARIKTAEAQLEAAKAKVQVLGQ